MADPISIVSLVGLAITTLTRACKTVADVHDAPNDAHDVARELEACRAVATSLRQDLEHPRGNPTEQWVETARLVLDNSCVTGQDLERQVAKGAGSFLRRSKWVVGRTDTARYIEQLRSYTQMLNMLRDNLLQ